MLIYVWAGYTFPDGAGQGPWRKTPTPGETPGNSPLLHARAIDGRAQGLQPP